GIFLIVHPGCGLRPYPGFARLRITNLQSRITNPESPIPAPSRVARVSGAHPGSPLPLGVESRERVGGSTHLPDRPSRMRPAALSGLRAITNHESPIPNHESRIPNPGS